MTKMRAYSMATVLRPWRASVPSSCVLEHDRFDDVGDVLEGVQRPLHRLDDVLPPQHLQGVELAAEQAGEDATVDSVALALEAVDGVEMGLDAFHGLEALEQCPGLLGALDEEVGLLLRSGSAEVMPVICMRCDTSSMS